MSTNVSNLFNTLVDQLECHTCTSRISSGINFCTTTKGMVMDDQLPLWLLLLPANLQFTNTFEDGNCLLKQRFLLLIQP
jgi:hypothetical protein